MPNREEWAEAYFAQAESDWAIFQEFLDRSDVPRSQSLHYLQMATEKLAKAYRLRGTATDMDTLLTRHVGFQSFLNTFILSPRMQADYQGRSEQLRNLRLDCNRLARAVERLAPAVDRAGHPGNAEYPWADGDRVIVPSRYAFPELSLLTHARGRRFLAFIQRGFNDFRTGSELG